MLIKNVRVSTNEVTQHGEILEPIVDGLYPNVRGNVNAPATGFVFEPFKRYYGDHDIRYINGGQPKSVKSIVKSGHSTVTLEGIQTEGSTPEPLTVDTVAYMNPANADPDGTTFPTGTVFSGLSFSGDDDGLTQSGLTILQGHDFKIESCGFRKSKVGLWMRDVWMTSIENVASFGQIKHEGGTSAFYKNVWAHVVDTDVQQGAFRISNLQYSTMNSCGSDGTINTAYYFSGNKGLTVNSCGSENPSTLDTALGACAHFDEGNKMVLNNFYTLPKQGTNILFSIGNNNDLTMNNTMVYGAYTKWSKDFWIVGTGNVLTINGGTFGDTGRMPVIATNSSGNTIIYNSPDGNSYIKKTTGPDTNLVLEPKYERRVLDSTSYIVFSNSGPISTGTKDIKLNKNGNLITVEFSIGIGSPGAVTGTMLLNGLPYIAEEQASGCVAMASGLTSGVGTVSVCIDRGSNELRFYRNEGTTGNTAPLTNTDMQAGATFRGSITYHCVSDWD